jgi:hypothetical protein
LTSPADAHAPSHRALTLALGAAVFALAFLFACQKIYDPDTWWHLATGRWVIEHHLIPAHDIFSFATAGAPWVAYSWLPATGMYAVHAAGGPVALVLVKALVVAGAFALAYALAVRARIHAWLAALALALAVPIARFQFRERPQILMFPLVALFFWLLGRPGAERRWRTWIALGASQVLWANVHGSYILGIALAGALFTERLVQAVVARLRGTPQPAEGSLPHAAGLLALVVAASLANPYGVTLLAQTIEDMGVLSVSRTFVNEEFQRLPLARYPGFVALAAATALSFAVAGRRVRPYVVLAFMGFALLAFGSVRFAAIAAFLFAFVLALNLQPGVERLGARLAAGGAALPARLVAGLLAGALAIFATAAFRASFGPGREARFGLGVNESRFPGPAVQYLARVGFEGNLFNSWVHGGYALWNLPKARDLMDGRAIPAHLALLDLLAAMDRRALDRWVAEHDVRGALLSRDDGFLPLFAESPRFARVFFDDRAVVYLRNDVAAAAPAAAAGSYRFIRPEVYDPSYLLPFATGPQAAEAEAELRNAVADAPESFSPRFLLGFFLEAQGKPEALEHYLAAGKLNAGLAFAHYDLGRRAGAIALGTGQEARVEPFLREALAVKKGDPVLEALLGSALYVQRRLPESERLLGRALEQAPDLPLALTNLGYLYVDTGRATRAVPLFRRARAAAPTDENAAYGLAFSLQAAGDRNGSADAWRRFLAEFPSSRWAPKARQRLEAAGAR